MISISWNRLAQIEKILFLGGIVLILLAFFGWNHIIELRAEEPRRAIISMEMILSGNYLVPQIHDWSYYNKPPLFNWWMVLFFKIFGSFDEWVVRFPSLIAFLATATVNYYIVKRFLKKETALLSSLFLLSSADLLFYGTVNAGEIDLFFSFITYLQVIAIFWFFEKQQFGRLFLISYLLAAAGTLTKGPPSIAFQALTLLPWLMINRQWRWLFSWKHFIGLGAYVLVVGGYFFWYSKYDDAIGFMVRLFKEASQRTGMEHSFLDTLVGAAEFPLLLLKLLAPWSLLVIFFLRKDFLKIIHSNSLLRFCCVFIVFNIPLYWFSADHRARYLYPFFPFFCIVLSYFFLNTNVVLGKWKLRVLGLFGVVMIIGSFACMAPSFIPQTAELPFITLKSAFLILLGILMIYGFQKYLTYKIYVFILFTFLMRIGFNMTYVPALAKESKQLIYKAHIQKVLEITGTEPVHWCGKPYTFESDASLGTFHFKDVKLTSAPLIAYQIPYYITKGNQHIMKFDITLQSNRFYLSHADFIKNKRVDVLYQFPDKWLNKEVVLFKMEDSSNMEE